MVLSYNNRKFLAEFLCPRVARWRARFVQCSMKNIYLSKAGLLSILLSLFMPANSFVMQSWTGAWGSDGPISTGDLNGDGKTDIFMWRKSSQSWTVNLSTGSGFSAKEWRGMPATDGPIFTGDLNGDGKTDVF